MSVVMVQQTENWTTPSYSSNCSTCIFRAKKLQTKCTAKKQENLKNGKVRFRLNKPIKWEHWLSVGICDWPAEHLSLDHLIMRTCHTTHSKISLGDIPSVVNKTLTRGLQTTPIDYLKQHLTLESFVFTSYSKQLKIQTIILKIQSSFFEKEFRSHGTSVNINVWPQLQYLRSMWIVLSIT